MSDVPEQPGAYRLEKTNEVIYVGSAKNLKDRYSDWNNHPDNPCVKRRGWDNFVWMVTSTHEAAKRLELEWYYQFNPECNLVAPPG